MAESVRENVDMAMDRGKGESGMTPAERAKENGGMSDTPRGDHYTDGRRWSHIHKAWVLESSWNEREEIASLQARLSEAQEKIERVEKENLLLTHKVITCGVAASHPDATLTERGVYVEKWNSPQADDVRVLRKRAQAAESRCAELREALWVCAEHNELHFGANHNTVIQARAALTKEAKHG